MKILTVASLKGGVGKSVTALHLAAYLSRRFGEGSTVLVDGDPNSTVLSWGEEGNLPFPVIGQAQAVRYANDFDYVVFDTKARPDTKDIEEISAGCHLLVIPSPPDMVCVRVLTQTVSLLEEFGRKDGYRALLTIVPPRPVRDGIVARQALEKAGVPLFDAEIRRRQVFQKAGYYGVPVREVKDGASAQAWSDYESFGAEVVGEVG